MDIRCHPQWGAVAGVAIGGVIRLITQSTVAGFIGGVVAGMLLCGLIYLAGSRTR